MDKIKTSQLEILEMLIMLDPNLQKDYEAATNRNVKAAASRVRNTMQRIKQAAQKVREEMLEIINQPDRQRNKKAILEEHQQSLESQLRKVKQDIATLTTETK